MSKYYENYLENNITIQSVPYGAVSEERSKISKRLAKRVSTQYGDSKTIIKLFWSNPEKYYLSIPKDIITIEMSKAFFNCNPQKNFRLVIKKHITKEMCDKVFEVTPLESFPYIPEKYRTPKMYKKLSSMSLEAYIAYVINYYDIPDELRDIKKMVQIFESNPDKWFMQIPLDYLSPEICEKMASLDIEKYIWRFPSEYITSEMYEKLVRINPLRYFAEVPIEKRTKDMYRIMFDLKPESYYETYSSEYMDMEMYERLLDINPPKYLHTIPEENLTQELYEKLALINPAKYLSIIPYEYNTLELYLKIIAKHGFTYIEYIPVCMWNDGIIDAIANIIEARKSKSHKIDRELMIYVMVLKKYPKLSKYFADTVIQKIIIGEIYKMYNPNLSEDELTENIINIALKYHLNPNKVSDIFLDLKANGTLNIKKESMLLKIQNEESLRGLFSDIDALGKIILSLGEISSKGLNNGQKVRFAYLSNLYLNNSLEEVYGFNEYNPHQKYYFVIKYFFEKNLGYAYLPLDPANIPKRRKIDSSCNPWLHICQKDEIIHCQVKYPNGVVINRETILSINDRLIMEEIPLNAIIVRNAYKAYSIGKLEDFIKLLHSYDNLFKESKVKKKKRKQ